MTNTLLHFKCFDRKGREGEPTAETYDLWLAPEHIVEVRAGFMRDNAASKRARAIAREDVVYKPDATRTTITTLAGAKHMVEGPPHVNVARIIAAKNGKAYDSAESAS